MRICLVSHQYLPEQRAGVEVLTHRLARALQDDGHDVLVWTARKDLGREDGSVVEEGFDGVPALRLIRNLFHADFRATFVDEAADAAFEHHVLEGFRPELVHVQHLMHHGLGLPGRAHRHGVPVVMTLHDYWLECPRHGTLLGWDEQLCATVDPVRCGRCLQSFAWRNPPALARVARGLRRLRHLTGLDLAAPLQRLWRRRRGRRPRAGATEPAPSPVLEAQIRERGRAVEVLLVPTVDRFLCPSRFLLERMAAAGLPRDRLWYQPCGVPRGGTVRAPGPAGREGPIRFGFLGSVLPHKGVHVLLEAAALLRARGVAFELTVHGGSAADPGYGDRIRARAEALGVRVTGPYLPVRIDALLAGLDVLVVPSLWYENSPVTIWDARVRGIPALVSDLGALGELVPEARLRFAPGDPAALAAAMEALVGLDPAELGALGQGPMPPDPDEEVRNTLKHYAALCR